MFTRKRLISLGFVAVLILVGVLYFVDPFAESDLEKWRDDVSEERYNEALDILENSLRNRRVTYFDFYEDITVDYDLPTNTAATLQTDPAEGFLSDAADLSPGKIAIYEVEVPETGYYTIDSDYLVEGQVLNNITISVAINGMYQFDDAMTIDVPLLWSDRTKEFDVDTYGDQTLPLQDRNTDWNELELYNNTYISNEPLVFYFEEGLNTISFENVSNGDLRLKDVKLNPPLYIPTYEEYIASVPSNTPDEAIEINAISYAEKNSSYVRLMSFSNPALEPFNSEYKKLNALDGNAWYKAGQNVSFNVCVGSCENVDDSYSVVSEAGLYDLTLHYANYKPDFDVFRSIRVDGKIPYQEVASYAIEDTPSSWANLTIQDENNNPYKIYLSEGMHTITFRAEKSALSENLRNMQLMIDHINQFALDIIKITGKDIDRDRTWRITNFIPETEDYLKAYQDIIKYMVVDMAQYSDKQDLSASLSYLKKAVFEFDKMLEDPDELPLYLGNLYNGASSTTLLLGESLDSLSNQQLYLDSFYLSNDGEFRSPNANIFRRTGNSINSFVVSFTSDKFVIENDEDVIDVWVNRPLTYVDIMQKMVDADFTKETGVKVKVSVMPDPNKLILANSAGNTPDVALGLMSFMPFDLAIRGALYDMAQFDDFWSVANRFAPGAIVPYILDDGVYAIPETLEFHALVYRKDVFNALEIEVPDTWDDVIGILPTLQRYDMNFYYPTAGGTALKWFYQTSPLIYQFNGSLYSDDGLSTTINEENSIKGLQLLGDLYTTYSLPEQVQIFYNSFRYNKLPVGIIDFATYMQLKNAAPELVGQWALAPYPGVYNEETDQVDRWYIGNGTGGVMFKNTNDPDGAWEFMKWWTSTNVQTDFGYTLQSTYGPEYLWLSGNIEAVENSPLDNQDKDVIMEQIKWLRDVPRTPGQYMLERGLSNIWNTVTFDGTPVRVAIDREVILIDREIKRKLVEFGYLDNEGNVLKVYTIRDVDWIQEQMDIAKGGGE